MRREKEPRNRAKPEYHRIKGDPISKEDAEEVRLIEEKKLTADGIYALSHNNYLPNILFPEQGKRYFRINFSKTKNKKP